MLVISGAATASAADSSSTISATPLTPSVKGDHQGPLAGLVAKGTITQGQADAIKVALQAQHSTDKTARDTATADALAALVSKGTITQAQATAITNADRHGLRDLVSNGTLTKDHLMAVITALKALRPAKPMSPLDSRLSSVLSSLVAKGTITQAQADAVIAAKPTREAKGFGHGAQPGSGQHGHAAGRTR
jgi:competence protein ComGC